MKMIENEMSVTVPLEVIKASDIEPKEVKWLWYPYIPFGKVALLQGDPGDGKSKLMLSIVALLSKGEPLPFTDTEETEPMMHFTVEEENLICMYHNADRRRTIGKITAAMPGMDGDMWTLAQQTLSKLKRMTDSDYDSQKFYFTDENE